VLMSITASLHVDLRDVAAPRSRREVYSARASCTTAEAQASSNLLRWLRNHGVTHGQAIV
jgi:hypothetical protein